jgi:predicted permease
MIIGYIAAKKLSLDKRSISALVIYFITPVIVFYGTAKISFSLDTLLLPLLSFMFFSVSGIIARYIGKFIPALQPYQAMVGFM